MAVGTHQCRRLFPLVAREARAEHRDERLFAVRRTWNTNQPIRPIITSRQRRPAPRKSSS